MMTNHEFYQSQANVSSLKEALALFKACLHARQQDPMLAQIQALRLFNGFYEGIPGFVVDKFGKTLLLKSFDRDINAHDSLIETANAFYKTQLPDIDCVIVKKRHAKQIHLRQGTLLEGEPTQTITENDVHYALDLQLNQDDSFYLDTRYLRTWLMQNMRGKTVLNTFAYTGALGIAALAGGTKEVFQTDLSQKFLSLAQKSALLNPYSGKHKTLAGDYFKQMARFKSEGKLFDCVIIDPPLFSKTTSGEVNLLKNWLSLVNKARPLVGHDGWLILINNALFLSGEALEAQIQEMCASGYLDHLEIIDVPTDITGYPATVHNHPPVATTPYNHPTKINITRVRRKDGKRAS